MTLAAELGSPSPVTSSQVRDGRGSPVPTWAMITTRFMELRKRRGLMITLASVTIGLPTLFLAIRIVLHIAAPKTYGPAGGYDTYVGLTTGVLYVFGFIVAAALGCSAGSLDLSEGVFRHLVVTGRSRVALYLARIPAGLAIVVPLVAAGFALVCAVCVFAAPNTVSVGGTQVPVGLSQSGLQSWAVAHPTDVICGFPQHAIATLGVGCAFTPNGPSVQAIQAGTGSTSPATPEQIHAAAAQIASSVYPYYQQQFATPPLSLMLKTGLWLELEAVMGFVVGLGLGSLLGQRTLGVILMIVLELVLTPAFIRAQIPHLINVQRGVVGVAMAQLEPGHLPLAMGGGGADYRVTESTLTAVLVILGWLVGWTGLGAWRMATRDV